MFEGLFQPMHLLVIFFDLLYRLAGVRSQETARTGQGDRRRNSCFEGRYERGRLEARKQSLIRGTVPLAPKDSRGASSACLAERSLPRYNFRIQFQLIVGEEGRRFLPRP